MFRRGRDMTLSVAELWDKCEYRQYSLFELISIYLGGSGREGSTSPPVGALSVFALGSNSEDLPCFEGSSSVGEILRAVVSRLFLCVLDIDGPSVSVARLDCEGVR